MMINQVVAVKKGERVLIVTDDNMPQTITQALTYSAISAGGEVVVALVHGEHQYLCFWTIFLDLAGGRQAVYAGHGDIHQYHLRAKLANELQSGLAARGLTDHLDVELGVLPVAPRLGPLVTEKWPHGPHL